MQYTYVEDIVHNEELFSEWQIKNLHRLVLKEIDNDYAGVYRDQQVFISGAQHTPPEPLKIQEQMEGLMKWYEVEAKELHPHCTWFHVTCNFCWSSSIY